MKDKSSFLKLKKLKKIHYQIINDYSHEISNNTEELSLLRKTNKINFSLYKIKPKKLSKNLKKIKKFLLSKIFFKKIKIIQYLFKKQ